MLVFIDGGYELHENSWCSPRISTIYPTLTETKQLCNNDPSCTMFYDSRGAGNAFYWCDSDGKVKNSTSGSLLYIKRSEYVCSCTLFWNSSNHNVANVFTMCSTVYII